MLKGKKILLGITASIAAYKAAMLVRFLVKEGAEVKVLMTPFATKFITPLTMATLSQNPVLIEFYKAENGDWNSHVDLGLWADLYLIAPATANTMGKMVHGIADNLLLTTYLSAKCPVFAAPAMDLDMFRHPSTTRNVEVLKSYGNHIIEPASGELASGLLGKGRMEEPEVIVGKIKDFFFQSAELKNKTFLITAGPTYEPIDPVRFIGNHSSGKMGYAIAEELASRGAQVVLISGTTALQIDNEQVKLIKVSTAEEMYQASIKYFPETDGAIMSAAVSDFTPVQENSRKVKRGKENWQIEFRPTKDIAAQLGKMKTSKQILVGFALETNDELKNAQKKLRSKNLDFIVLNSLQDKGAGFRHDTNKISIVDRNNNVKDFELKPKTEVAKDIVAELISIF